MSRILILTGCDVAMAAVGDLTSANHCAYALRHGYDFERVTEYEPESHPSWQKLRLIRERLPNYDAILWLDADTVVTNPLVDARIAFREHIFAPMAPLTVSMDWTHPNPEDAIKHFSLGNFVFTNCPESFELIRLAELRTEWANQGLWEQQAIQEEFRANEAVRPWVRVLPRRALNAVPATPATTGPEPWEPGDFLCHMTYLPNEERVQIFPQFDNAGLASLVFDLPRWHEIGMCVDLRHIACLREIALGAQWKKALEIGVWKGSSTVALRAGLRAGTIEHYPACDVGFTQEFECVVDGHHIWREHCRSVEVLADESQAFDLIFVDGDHGLETGKAEAELLLQRQPAMIVLHDVESQRYFENCEGPAWIRARLMEDGWLIVEDTKDRPGEMTKRGFLAATKDPELHEVAKRAFALTCY